ncbi:MAG: class I SAM-dependent methyltransferase [bacterium]
MNKSFIENYYEDGSRYDLDYELRIRDIQFYVDKCCFYGNEVLELGCGTGRVTIPIARSGLNVTAVDSSESMLKRAQKKLLEEKKEILNNVNFVLSDIRELNLDRKFKTVIMPFNVLQHLYDMSSINHFFSNLREHLDDNSVLIFDVLNPDLYELSRSPNDHAIYDSFHVTVKGDGRMQRVDDDKGSILVIEDSINYNSVEQIADYTLSYSLGAKDLFELSLRHRIFFTKELEYILNTNGLHVLECFGDFDLSPLAQKSPSQVFVCMYKN